MGKLTFLVAWENKVSLGAAVDISTGTNFFLLSPSRKIYTFKPLLTNVETVMQQE